VGGVASNGVSELSPMVGVAGVQKPVQDPIATSNTVLEMIFTNHMYWVTKVQGHACLLA
jgi:hypothetical protein